MAKAQQPEKVKLRDRLKQIRMVFAFTAKRDRMFVPLVALAVLVPLVLVGLVVWLTDSWLWIPAGVLLALLGVMIVLNLRSNTAMMAEAENQPGAAASILEMLRGDWRVTPAVQLTTQNDFVHRVIGRPGVILVGEGAPARARSLLAQEKKKLSKVVGTSTPIYDFMIGNGEGEMPIRKLRMAVMKLPRNITGKQVNALETRLTALSAGRPQMPKGPIPKNLRPPRGAMRGR
ncbi:DUF4191 domain-containing protein [Longispora albida]|uniref:DUF4191 domain-containing protein n=1 Tax=Longispora albida TaxID=203523 RepID=UPI000477CA88|nr:DUF4191 domain-containing protein [Longispora albida]